MGWSNGIFGEYSKMRGVLIKKANVIAEDKRRKIISVLNGEIGVRDIHILIMKKGETQNGFIKLPLGEHYHTYKEVCYCFKGKAHYKLKHEITGEELEIDLNEGELMFRDAFISHTCLCTEDCILIDGAQDTWVDEDWNHYKGDKLM